YTKFVKSLYFIMILVPTTSTLFPYTTLFRSRRPLLAWMESCNLSLRGDRPLLASLARPAFSPNAIDVPGFGKVARSAVGTGMSRSEEHTSELQSRENLVCRLLLEKKKKVIII